LRKPIRSILPMCKSTNDKADSLRQTRYPIDCQQCQVYIEDFVNQAVQFSLIAHWAGESGFAIWLIDDSKWGKPIGPFIVNMIFDSDLVNRWETHDSLVFRLARNENLLPIKHQRRDDERQRQVHSRH